MKKYLIAFSVIALTSTAVTSCGEDFVDTEFFQSKPQEDIKTIEELQSFVFGAYGTMRGASYYGCDFVTIPELRSDAMYSNNRSGYYSTVSNYTMLSGDAYASGPYTAMYTTIAKANIILGRPRAGSRPVAKWSSLTSPYSAPCDPCWFRLLKVKL